MGLSCNIYADLIEVGLHRGRVAIWSDQGCPHATFRADRAEDISICIALIGGLAWPGSLVRPKTRDAVFLSNAHLVLEPDFNRRVRGHIFYGRF